MTRGRDSIVRYYVYQKFSLFFNTLRRLKKERENHTIIPSNLTARYSDTDVGYDFFFDEESAVHYVLDNVITIVRSVFDDQR